MLIILSGLPGTGKTAIARAQSPAQRGATPGIVSGGDLGFRVARQEGNRVIGTLVVRINGEWFAAEPAAALTFK